MGETWQAPPGPASCSESTWSGEDRMTEAKLGVAIPSDTGPPSSYKKDALWDSERASPTWYILRMFSLIETQCINSLRYADATTLMPESEGELKSAFMRAKEGSGKAGPKSSIQKTKIVASGLITSWRIEGGEVEAMTGFILLGLKITADGDCSHEIERRLLLGRKAVRNLDGILKSRDITLPTKVHIVKARVFTLVM